MGNILGLSYISNLIFEIIKEPEQVKATFYDLAKEFDTAVHEILLQKPENYGIRSSTLISIRNYLPNRYQYVN